MHNRKIYEGEWSCQSDLLKQFGNVILDYTVLYAEYDRSGYEGECFVLLKDKNGDWFEVNSSHCSCNDLDWNIELTTKKAILHRVQYGKLTKALLEIDELKELVVLL